MSVEPIFIAFGEPIRRRLLETIAVQGPRTATELARIYPITRQAIIKHLHVPGSGWINCCPRCCGPTDHLQELQNKT